MGISIAASDGATSSLSSRLANLGAKSPWQITNSERVSFADTSPKYPSTNLWKLLSNRWRAVSIHSSRARTLSASISVSIRSRSSVGYL